MRLGVNLTHHMLNVESFCSSALKATLDSECQLILVLTETAHKVLLIDKFWHQAAILQCERSGETLVTTSFFGEDLLIQKGLAHAKCAVTVGAGMKRHGRSFNEVELVACLVFSRSCCGVDAQQVVAADPDSRVREVP